MTALPETTPGGMVPVVHFPHPGTEHWAPSIGHFAWSTLAVHRRKFLRATGSYLDTAACSHAGDLTFWGEWEAASEVVETWGPSGVLPTALHLPIRKRRSRVRPGEQNTDPWVFGDHFRYTNCRQRGAMRSLPPGSLVLFGSTVNGEFELDTVFVVQESSGPLPLTSLKKHPFSDAVLNECTYDSLSGTTALNCAPGDTSSTFVLYRGATPAERPAMFSYAPAKPGVNLRFSRPILRLGARPSGDPYVNPASWRNTKGSPRSQWVPTSEAQRVWDAVTSQVFSDGQGLVLAHHLDDPSAG